MEQMLALILDGFLRFDEAGKMPIPAPDAAMTFTVGYGIDPLQFSLMGALLQAKGLVVLDEDGLIRLTDAGRVKAKEIAALLDLAEQDPELN